MTPVFSHRIEVRFRDCDPMGHVNNAAYLTYLEQARFAHWRALWGFSLEAIPAGAPGVILARAEIDYRAPARYGDLLDVRIGLVAIGHTSFTYEYEVLDASGGLVASARTVQVMYDYREARPVPVPDEIRARLGQQVGDGMGNGKEERAKGQWAMGKGKWERANGQATSQMAPIALLFAISPLPFPIPCPRPRS